MTRSSGGTVKAKKPRTMMMNYADFKIYYESREQLEEDQLSELKA